MKKKKLVDLAVIGITMGLLLNGCTANSQEKMTPEQQAFYEMLDPAAQKQFLELDKKHRAAALSVTEQYCKAPHECVGLREEAVNKQYELQRQAIHK